MSDKSKEVVIVGALRTPIGRYEGSLKQLKADELGSIVLKEILKKWHDFPYLGANNIPTIYEN